VRVGTILQSLLASTRKLGDLDKGLEYYHPIRHHRTFEFDTRATQRTGN